MRRPVRSACLALAAVALFPGTAGATAQRDDDRKLPATHLEVEERDDGNTDAAAWMVGSGLAAIVVVGVGGTWLTRRQRRSDPDGPPRT